MASRRTALARALVTAASASYAANCALGASVATGLVNTRGHRWVHHALYVTTSTLTGAATVALLIHRDGALWPLLPTLPVLAAMPRASARTPRHAQVGLSAAPFYVTTLHRVWRS